MARGRVDAFLDRLSVTATLHFAVVGLVMVLVAGAAYGPKTASGVLRSNLPDTYVTRVVTEVSQPGQAAVPPASVPQPFPGRIPGSTSQVISVVASSTDSHFAILKRWSRTETATWRQVGPAVRVAVGSGGLTPVGADSVPRTPLGTWAMDVVLSRDPGVSRMPTHVLAPGDGWSSCTTCADYDRLSDSGELWNGRDSWARIAIHIVTNPNRVPGRSSGIFLHVGQSRPTFGCVGVPAQTALEIARWLDPAANPRIAISVLV